MNSISKALLFPTLCFASQFTTAAAGPPKAPDKFDVPAIDAFFAAQAQRAGRVGLSVAIVKDGQVVLAKAYGARSREDGRLADTNTLFAIGSVSKQFTCACILLLAEDGKLSVQDPVAKFFPDLSRAKDITLLDLMNHVAGYPDYYPLDFVDRRMAQPIQEDDLLRRYAGGKLDFEPGSKRSYSNTGYILLGRVVEKVSGEPFGAFLTRRIFQPLGMDHTVYEPGPADGRLAQGYTTFALSEPEAIGPEGNGWLGAAGGIYSTPGDLAKWDLALIDGKVLKPASYELMTARRKLADGRLMDYGCGLAVKLQEGRLTLIHSGAVSGFNAWNGIIPSTRSALIVTCNVDGGVGSLPDQIFPLLLKEPTAIPTISGPPAAEAVKAVFAKLQKGKTDRKEFAEEFNHFLTNTKIAAAAKRLKRFGAPTSAEVLSTHERGGMEVTTTRLTFKSGALKVLMYRAPDGKIEQFFVSED
ncbi:MAG: beta-lactamase family protein [Verrucomicrobia bacterium]|nr:beta-lactamase family protein [Verrucomicrobiota bacterium]